MDIGSTLAAQGNKAFARPHEGHVSLGTPLRVVLFLVPVLIVAGILLGLASWYSVAGIVVVVIFTIVAGVAVSGVRVAAEWERGVVLRLGRFKEVKGPGIMYIIPLVEYVRFIDTRILALNIPSQKVITKDNVPAEVDGVLFFLVADAQRAVIKIQDFSFAIAQYAQASLRDVVGGLSLDELLTEREQIQQHIGAIVEERIKEWGIHVDSIRLLDIDVPEDLKRMMSRQASAEREKRATITKAEGDKLAAANLAEAADTMRESTGAMQLRSLQTIDGLGASASNTVLLFPVELSEAVQRITKTLTAKAEPPEEPKPTPRRRAKATKAARKAK